MVTFGVCCHVTGKPVYMKKRRASGIPDEDDGLEHHRRNMCLGCYRVRNKGQNESGETGYQVRHVRDRAETIIHTNHLVGYQSTS